MSNIIIQYLRALYHDGWRKKAYSVFPVRVSEDQWNDLLKAHEENKGRVILRFINDYGEVIDDLHLKAIGFSHPRSNE